MAVLRNGIFNLNLFDKAMTLTFEDAVANGQQQNHH
jgi:hypothetical protein